MSKSAKLLYDGKEFELPLIEGSENEKALDISKLLGTAGLITMDKGFKNTGSTTSSITYLDGKNGILRYRGYSIEELAEKATFLEVAYLLIYGELPTPEEYKDFENKIKDNVLIHEDMHKIFDGFPASAHPMGVLSSLVSSLTAFHPESLNPHRSPDLVDLTIIRLIAKMPTLVAWTYKNALGESPNYPKKRREYSENFLYMMFRQPSDSEYDVDPIVIDALNKLLILHADHEQNCSTATVRVVGSSLASLYACVAAGINALWGKLHGGANQSVIEMLEMVKQDGGNIKKYIEKAKDKNDPFRLMGFGHRVYKNFDPRAKIIKKACDNVLAKLGIQDPTLDIAKELERITLEDDYFVQRNLYPNVDFYSGIIYRALGIPTELFTPMFALGRLPGWIAQWKEMTEEGQPISRPRQIYTGHTQRPYKDQGFKNY